MFDCDGTLVDSQANIVAAMDAAFVSSGLEPPPHAATRRIVGLSLVEAMRVLWPQGDDAAHRTLAADYKSAFHDLRMAGALADEPLFDGIRDVIEALRAEGWALGVATGKSDRGLGHILEAHALTDTFVTLQTADRHPSKPDPAMLLAAMAEAGATARETVMIGDTSFDMAMGRAAGVRTVGVAWGYHAPHELVAAGADVVAETVASLPRLMAP